MKITKTTRFNARPEVNGVEKLKPINYEKLAKGLFFEAQEQQVKYVGGMIVGLHRSKPEIQAIGRNLLAHLGVAGFKALTECIIGQSDILDGVTNLIHEGIALNTGYNAVIGAKKCVDSVSNLTQEQLDAVLEQYYAKAEAAGMCEDEDLFDEESI